MSRIMNRILGLDILRILSMCGIVGLHMINQGGVIDNIPLDSLRYPVILIMLSVFYLSVNIFGVLSGYLGINKKKQRYSRIVELLAILFFYIIVQAAVFYGFNICNVRQEGIKTFLVNIFPFAVGKYWYITCYTLVFFMMPYLNRVANILNQKQYKKLLITLFILLSVIPNLFFKIDFFRINNGYSPFWLIFLYLIGGYIKLYPPKIKAIGLKIVACVAISFLVNYATRIITNTLLGHIRLSGLMIDYISPLNVIASSLIVLLFADIKGLKCHKIAAFFSNAAFSVYIMQGNMFFTYIITGFLSWTNDINIVNQIIVIIVYILGIYISASIIDQIRKPLFGWIKRRILSLSSNRVDKNMIEKGVA